MNLHTIVTFISLGWFILPVRCRPQSNVINAANASTESIVLYGYEGCDEFPDGISQVYEGFRSLERLAMPMDPINRGDPKRYQPIDWKSAAAVEFFGPGYKTGKFGAYRENVQTNMNRLASTDAALFLGWHLHVRCDDPETQCLCWDGTKTEAYTMHDASHKDQINFCPAYFQLKSLTDTVDHGPDRDNIGSYWNQACVWAHEILHVSWLGKPVINEWPYMWDQYVERQGRSWRAYRMLDAKYLAYSQTVEHWKSISNPQNYAWFALANYVQKQKKFYPSQDVWWWPRDDPPPPANPPTAEAETTQDQCRRYRAPSTLRNETMPN